MQWRCTIGPVATHIQFVTHLVNHHITALPGFQHRLPGQDHRALVPGLTSQHRATGVHHTVLTLPGPVGDKVPFIKNDRVPAVVVADWPVLQRYQGEVRARLRDLSFRFLARKSIAPGSGFVITDAMCLRIATSASVYPIFLTRRLSRQFRQAANIVTSTHKATPCPGATIYHHRSRTW